MKTSKNMLPGAARTAAEAAEPRGWYPLLLIFLVLTLGTLAWGIFSYRNYERHVRTGIEQQLVAIAELKVAQIVHWRREPLMDAKSKDEFCPQPATRGIINTDGIFPHF